MGIHMRTPSYTNNSRRILLGITGGSLALTSKDSKAQLVKDLLEKTTANKEINDKKRLATSYANFARSRTVADNTCRFPDNFFGCQNAAEIGNVPFLTDDISLECKGKEGKCSSRSKGSLPSFMGV